MEKHCPNCRTAFQCTADCWCSVFPPIIPFHNGGAECLCPSCLKVKIQDQIQTWTQNLTPKKIKFVQQMGKPKQLQEGIDYTLNEQGFLVFTSWYLLRQGKCCGNGCTHCPYQNLEKS